MRNLELMSEHVSKTKLIWQTLFTFFFIYEVQHFVMPDLFTSRKLMFYFSAFVFFTRYSKNYFSLASRASLFKGTTKTIFILGLIMVLWQLLLTLFNTNVVGEPILGRTILFFVLTSMFCIFAYYQYDNLRQFLLATFFATLLQAAIVISDYFSDAVKLFLYNNFVLDANFGYLSPMRAAGLGAGESLLSIDLYLGLVCTSILILTSRQVGLYILGYITILFSCLLSGTTGFMLGVILLVITVILVTIYGSGKQRSYTLLFGYLAIFLLITLAATFFEEIEEFRNFEKITDFGELGIEDQATVSTLKSQKVAPLSIYTLIGTSIFRGTAGPGITTMSDTGYLQAYFGHGLIFALIFYITLYKQMYKNVKRISNKLVYIVASYFFLTIMAAEAKEPYIYHYGITFVFFMICFLSYKTNTYNENKHNSSNI